MQNHIPSGYVTGDTVHFRSALTDDLPMGSDYNTLDSVRSIRRMAQIAESRNAEIWVAHDPGDWKTFGGAGRVGLTAFA